MPTSPRARPRDRRVRGLSAQQALALDPLLLRIPRYLLNARHAAGRPVRVGLIGAGKFGSMFLSQAPHTPGLHIPAIVDLVRDGASVVSPVGWHGAENRALEIHHRWRRCDHAADIEVVVDATGHPAAGIRHALAAIAAGAHRHGQRRGRRAGRPAARGRSAQGRHRLFAGLWRSAGADLRNGRLGARRRL